MNCECLWQKTQREKNYNSQAMCSYLQSEQCHSIDLLNLLITSREMFSLFLRYYFWNTSHSVMVKSGFLMWYKTSTKYLHCGNLKMHSWLRKFCNQPICLLLTRANGHLHLQIAWLKKVKKLYFGMVSNSTMK